MEIVVAGLAEVGSGSPTPATTIDDPDFFRLEQNGFLELHPSGCGTCHRSEFLGRDRNPASKL